MCKPFGKWKEIFKEDGTSAIDGLEDIFEEDLLLDQLGLTKVEEVRKNALGQELHKIRIAGLLLLTEKEIEELKAKTEQAKTKRQNLEEARKKVIDFRDKQQRVADFLEKEDIDDIESNVKKEEDSIKAQIKELESIAKEIKAIDDDIKAKETDKAKKEAEYEDTEEIEEYISKKKQERDIKYQEFKNKYHNETQKIINPCSSYAEQLKKLETKKREREGYLRKVKQSNVIIQYIDDNLRTIVGKRAIKKDA